MQNFFSKEAPYFVTILFASLGWFFTTIVDRVVTAPTVEYRVESPCRESGNYCVELTNLSNQAFKKLSFQILYDPDSRGVKILSGDVEEVSPPAWPSVESGAVANNAVEFTVSNFQPGVKVILKVKYSGKSPPFLLFTNSNDAAVSLTKAGLRTWFVNCELVIYFALSVLWTIAIAFWLFRTKS